jgi:hypothetical protein
MAAQEGKVSITLALPLFCTRKIEESFGKDWKRKEH